MKVLVAHNRYRSGTPSGENRVVDTESDALTAAGHDVVRFEMRSDDISGWPLPRRATLAARVVWNQAAYRGLADTLRDCGPDVVHVHNTFPLLSPAILYACRRARVPVVLTVHNYRLSCASGDFFRDGVTCHACAQGPRVPIPAVVHGCYRGSRTATIPAALAIGAHRSGWRSLVSAYVFISAAQRDLLSGLRLPPERVFVAHNLVPRQQRCQRPPSLPAALYAGRLEEAKGVRLLMSAWDRFRAASRDAGLRLLIAGTGSLDREVAGWAATRPSVEFLGHVPGARCAELMAQARAVIVPSLWQEAFGLVVVEAMAAGTPPIASEHGSFAELITPGLDGVLVPPGDADALALVLADVAADPGRYRAYGDQARITYEERFNPDDHVNRLVEIYRFAISNPASMGLAPGDHRRPSDSVAGPLPPTRAQSLVLTSCRPHRRGLVGAALVLTEWTCALAALAILGGAASSALRHASGPLLPGDHVPLVPGEED
jgi:glycosyltransferase involved in cell wall biosynthesis